MEALQQVAQHILHFRPGQRVQCAEGLVHQQQFGFRRQRPRQADTLALSAGKLIGQAAGKGRIIQSDLGKQLARTLGDLLLGAALDFEHRADIALGVEVRKEARLLDHVPDRTPQGDRIPIRGGLCFHHHPSRGRLDQAVYHAQQRGLSRPAAPQQRGGGTARRSAS